MVKLLQRQTTVSHTTHMQVDGGANCHGFWDKHLFYILFVRPTSIHDAGGSTFSSSGVGLLHVMLPGYPTLHVLAPDYWTPKYHTNTLSLSALKFHIGFIGASHEALSSCTCRESQRHNFTVKAIRKKY